MSSLPYPSNFERNLEEERYEARYAMAVQQLDAGDVIAAVEARVAGISDPQAHPLYHVVAS